MDNINYKESTIIDVRNIEEYEENHVPGSINIPMHDIIKKVEDIKKMKKPIVLCCKSGNRSGKTFEFLKAQNIENIHNGGGWKEVLNKLKN